MKLTILMARALALVWAVFWLLFFIAESLAWHTPADGTVSWGCVGLSFVVVAILPWRWEGTGGLALALLGMLMAVAYPVWSPPRLPLSGRIITAVVLGGPPFSVLRARS